jgi:hypothetical protein
VSFTALHGVTTQKPVRSPPRESHTRSVLLFPELDSGKSHNALEARRAVSAQVDVAIAQVATRWQ